MAAIKREDLIFNIKMGLMKASFVPKKWSMDVELQTIAEQLVDHLTMCGIVIEKKDRPSGPGWGETVANIE